VVSKLINSNKSIFKAKKNSNKIKTHMSKSCVESSTSIASQQYHDLFFSSSKSSSTKPENISNKLLE
jgi:hypothetical protein